MVLLVSSSNGDADETLLVDLGGTHASNRQSIIKETSHMKLS